MSSTGLLARTLAFENRFAKAQATEIIDLSWGFAVLQRDFPLSHMHNRIVVTSTAPASEIIAVTERILGGEQLSHRYLSFADSLHSSGDSLTALLIEEIVAAGYEHEAILTMVHDGRPVEPASHQVHDVSLAALRPALMKNWRTDLPDSSEEAVAQLADRTALYERGADVALLAVYEGDQIAAHATFFVDRAARIAQFENLNTHPEFRGRGYAGALLRDAQRRSAEAGCDLNFLTADLEDWPQEWYRRVGYDEVGRSHHFTRTA